MISVSKFIAASSPFPIMLEKGVVLDGLVYSKTPMCQSCAAKICYAAFGSSQNRPVVCPNGNTIFSFSILGLPVLVCGVVTDLSRHRLDSKLRDKFLKRTVSSQSVLKWISGVSRVLQEIEKEVHDLAVENLEAFHDVLPSISLIQRDVEKLVWREKGVGFEQKFMAASPEIKDLFKSMEILVERVNLMPLLTNPEKPRLGGRRNKHIFKMIDTLGRSFRVLAKEKRIKINLSGQSHNTPAVYGSFSAVPFVLFDNAIKYSLKDQPVEVSVNDFGAGGVEIVFQSYGPIVPEDKRKFIFDKKFRYTPPGWERQKGSGLGLYIARIVAQAHGFEIEYTAKPNSFHENEECGLNIFSFKVGG